MSLSFKQLNEKAIAKKGITLTTPTDRFKHFQDLIDLVSNMDTVRSSAGSTCSTHTSKGSVGYSFAAIDNALTAMKGCTCDVQNTTDTQSGTPQCSCNLRTACSCHSVEVYGYYNLQVCSARTCCTCNSEQQQGYCSCNILVGACDCNAASVCTCHTRTAEPACFCNTDDKPSSCSCNTVCQCHTRSPSCLCNTRCSCNLRVASDCSCNVDIGGSCTCVSRTAEGWPDSQMYTSAYYSLYTCECVTRVAQSESTQIWACSCQARTACPSHTTVIFGPVIDCSSRVCCDCNSKAEQYSYYTCTSNVGCQCQSEASCACNTRCSCNSLKSFT